MFETICKSIIVVSLLILFSGVIYGFLFVDKHDPKYLNNRYCDNSGIMELISNGLSVRLSCKNGAKFEIANRNL